MRSPENVLESLKSKACNKSYKYERLYRNLYNPQFYLLAYQRIQAKPGNMTAGTDGKTIDGMGMARINALIEKMRDFSYQPNPARRTYIPKSNGKMRPLGIPSFDDKLIQEVVRLILESIYEPTFSDYSHGFRINRSCHTALKYVQKYFTGTKWFVEGDIKGCFDNVDHHVLIAILRKRIADEHFIGLLWKFLKAGYMEDWNYHNTYSGTPQGSIISPILANIYMNELDSYMAEYAEKFNCGNRRKINPAFKKKLDVCRGKEQRLKRNLSKMSEEEKEGLIAEIRELRRSLKSMPYSDQMDDSYKRICYIRYADDFLIGVIGSKEDAEQIKQDVGCFIRDKLHLEMSEEKTLITHGHDAAKFLGYEVTIAKGEHNKKTKTGATRRVNNGKVLLYVPHDKWVKRLFSYNALKIKYDKQNGNKEVWEPVRRTRLLHLDDLEILNQYNAEIRGLYNYYRLANNVSVLNNFYYVMRYSMLKTFAGKYRTRISRIIRKYRQGKDFVVEYPKKNGKVGKVLFYNNGFRRDTKVESGNPDIVARIFENYGRNSLIKRLQANDIFGINQTRPAPGVDVIDIGGGDIVRAAHHRGQKILLFHSRPAGGIAHGGILRQIVFEAQGTAVGSRFIVIGVGAIEIAGIDLPGGVECGILRRRRRIARQADGRDPAIRGVVLPDVQIVQIQTSWGIKAEGQRRCDAIAFVFNAVPTSVMGFFPHQVQTERSVVAKRLVQVESAPARPGAADAGRAVDPGVKARLLADHIDRAGGRAAAIVRAGGPFDDFHLLGIEGIARHAADVANAVHIDAVRGIHAAHKDGIPGG